MSIKNKRLNLLVDNDSYRKSKILREKYHINISSLCREIIAKTYDRLESDLEK